LRASRLGTRTEVAIHRDRYGLRDIRRMKTMGYMRIICNQSHCWKIILLAAALFASAALSSGQVPPAAVPGSVTPDVVAAYVLQRGDDIEIKAYNIPELDQVVRIRPDGKISVVLLNDIQAAGLTPVQLGEILSNAFATHYRNPRISVIVRGFSTLSVYVGGEVLRPGLIPLRSDTTVLQAVMEAGGLKETSHATSVLLLRGLETGTPQTITLNVEEILASKIPDVPLRPSDVLYVPKSNISVYVGGEVAHPGLLPLNGELTVLAAIFQAGGLKDTAKGNSVMLLRNTGNNSPMVRELKLEDVVKGKPDVVLQAFDIVYVPKSKIAKIDRFIDQYIRQLIPINIAAGFSYILGGTVINQP
jgi:polysaccharide export outer membrane protein